MLPHGRQMNGFVLSDDPFSMNDRSPDTCSSRSARGYELARAWVVDGFALLTAAVVASH